MDTVTMDPKLGRGVAVVTTRKLRRKSKKRPQSAPSVSKSNPNQNDYSADRYHATSFPLFSGATRTTLPRRRATQAEVQSHVQGSFPFAILPDYCKLRVFSFFTNLEKARLSWVCRNWNWMLKTPRLWNHILFSALPLGCLPSAVHAAANHCYDCYKTRVVLFVAHLLRIRPIVNRFEFKLDIADAKVKYLDLIESCLHSSKCCDLHYADMNWKETPALPFWESTQWCQSEAVIQTHRHRQRLFANFFNDFTVMAPNIRTLILPFDWSSCTVDYLSRLKDLHSLVLEKYFVFQNLSQHLLSRLLVKLSKLTRLMLEVWTPSGQGLLTYALASSSIQYLDISQSRGFYVRSLDMPRLRDFRVARHPWNGPLVMVENVSLPCLYEVLAKGTPRLETINGHRLAEGWQEVVGAELETVLKSVCSCRIHKGGWALY